jgi:hypothetical protein
VGIYKERKNGTVASLMPNESPSTDRGTGGRKRRVSNAEILRVFAETDRPVLTTGQVADELPLGKRQLQERLVELYENGDIERESVGARSYIWWRPGYTST